MRVCRLLCCRKTRRGTKLAAQRRARSAETVANLIRADIETGRLREGDKLPSIRQLMALHGIGRGAAQAAMSTLLAEGLIVARHGSGYHVQRFSRIRRVTPDRIVEAHRDPSRAIQDHDTGGRPRQVHVVVGEVEPPEVVADAFESMRPVVYRRRVFSVEDRPVQLAISYYPLDVARGTRIEDPNPGPGGVLGRLRELGLEPDRYEERVIARAPRPDEITALGMRRGGAVVLEITRLAWAAARCVEVTRMVLDAAAYELVYRFEIPSNP